MIRCSILSDNHIRKRKSQGNHTPVATETVPEVNAELEKKAKKNKIGELENNK